MLKKGKDLTTPINKKYFFSILKILSFPDIHNNMSLDMIPNLFK